MREKLQWTTGIPAALIYNILSTQNPVLMEGRQNSTQSTGNEKKTHFTCRLILVSEENKKVVQFMCFLHLVYKINVKGKVHPITGLVA
jgi:hypothetical protein